MIYDATATRFMEAQVNMHGQIDELKSEQGRLRREVETLLRIIDRQQGTINRLHDDKTVRIKTDRD